MKLENWTSNAESFMASIEAVLVSIVGRVACWLSPLPSAILVGRAAGRVFELDGWLAVIMAFTVELTGLVTSNLWLTAKEWNHTKRKSDPAANERLRLVLMVSYFVVTIALLLAAEIPHIIQTGNLAGLTVLLFPGLSAVGVIALNERTVHYWRVEAVKQDKADRKAKRQATKRKPSSRASKTEKTDARLDKMRQGKEAHLDTRLDTLLDVYLDNPEAGATEAARIVGVSRQTIYGYLDRLEKAGRISRGNGGVRVVT